MIWHHHHTIIMEIMEWQPRDYSPAMPPLWLDIAMLVAILVPVPVLVPVPLIDKGTF